jgi:hypothetical protein
MFEQRRQEARTGRARGPSIGERLPEVELPDQFGRLTALQATRGSQPALVSFDRSILW